MDAQTVLVDGREITAERVLIAVGATPFIPDIPGRAHAITSNEAFHLDVLPPPSPSLAAVILRLSCRHFQRARRGDNARLSRREILRGFDDEVRTHVHTEMAKKGITIKTQNDISEIVQTEMVMT